MYLERKKEKRTMKMMKVYLFFTLVMTSTYFGIILDEKHCNLGFKVYHFNFRPFITLRVKSKKLRTYPPCKTDNWTVGGVWGEVIKDVSDLGAFSN